MTGADENFERWRNHYRQEPRQEDKHFKDMFFHKHLSEMVVVNEGVPRWTVELRRDGANGVGEPMGVVEVRKINTLFTGEEPDLEEKLQQMWKDIQDGKPDADGVIRYRAPLEQAQGYAQGVYDGLRALLDVADEAT